MPVRDIGLIVAASAVAALLLMPVLRWMPELWRYRYTCTRSHVERVPARSRPSLVGKMVVMIHRPAHNVRICDNWLKEAKW